LDVSTRRVFISRHVVFDEQTFPFAATAPAASSFDFLLQGSSTAVAPSSLDVEHPRPLPATPIPESPVTDDLANPNLYQLVRHSRPMPSSRALDPVVSVQHVSSGADAGITGGSANTSSPTEQSLSHAAQPTDLRDVLSARQLVSLYRPTYVRRAPLVSPYRPTYVHRAPPVAVHGPICTTRAFRAQQAQDQQRHSMVTRSQTGTLRPVQRFNYTAVHIAVSPVPSNYRSALADPNWRAAMADEYKALVDNNTWRLVPRPPGANIVTGK
jgi:hypothetical protein